MLKLLKINNLVFFFKLLIRIKVKHGLLNLDNSQIEGKELK
jgi:hypothetical protein